MRGMRFILWLGLGLGVLWGGYWFVGAHFVETIVVAWFADHKAAGLVAENTGVSVSGFADRFDMTVSDPDLADPATGWGWQAPFAQVFAMTWKPWHLIAALPHSQVIKVPGGQKVTISSTRMMASLLMQPKTSLPPERLVIEGEGLALTSDANWTLGAEKLVLAAEKDPTRANTLHLGADATNLGLPAPMAALPDLGPIATLVHLDASVALSAPIAWQMEGAQVLGYSLTSLHIIWGRLDLSGQGAVTADATGLAIGKIDFTLKGWRSLPSVVVALGLVKPEMKESLTRALEFLAASSPDPEVLTLALTFKDGQMSLGPLPLGPSPRLN